MMEQVWISLPLAASRLGWSWGRTYNAALAQRLEARQSQGRWLVSEASVDRLLRERAGPLVAQAAS
jgi:hypothetical protein